MPYIDSIRKDSKQLVCTLKKRTDLYYVKDNKVYGCKYDGIIYTCEHGRYSDLYMLLDLGTHKIKVHRIFLDNVYPSLEDVKNGRPIYSTNSNVQACFKEKYLIDILSECIGVGNFRYYDAGANYFNIRRYKWSGFKAVEVGFEIPDTIYYDGSTFTFTTPLSFEDGTYGKKYECEDDNEMNFVPYGGNESVSSKKEKTIAFAASPFGKSISLNLEFREENGELSVEIKKIS